MDGSDNRRTYPWGNENLELIEFHKYDRDFTTGFAAETRFLKTALAGRQLIAYGRFCGPTVSVP